MCKLLLPRCTFHTFLQNVCFLFTRSRKRMNPKLHCVPQQLLGGGGGGGCHLSLFYLVQCPCPVISFLLKFLLFPVSVCVLTIQKERKKKKPLPRAFVSSVAVGILTKDFSAGRGSNQCPATSCYQRLRKVRKRRHPRLSEKLRGSHPPSVRPRRETD